MDNNKKYDVVYSTKYALHTFFSLFIGMTILRLQTLNCRQRTCVYRLIIICIPFFLRQQPRNFDVCCFVDVHDVRLSPTTIYTIVDLPWQWPYISIHQPHSHTLPFDFHVPSSIFVIPFRVVQNALVFVLSLEGGCREREIEWLDFRLKMIY